MRQPAPSGRFLLRMEPVLHGRLRAAARAAEVSLNEYCIRQLARPAVEEAEPAEAVVAHAEAVLGAGLVGVVAFGSWARGELGAASDVDVLIVAKDVSITRELYRRWDATPLQWEGHAVEPHFVRLPAADAKPSGLWAEVSVDGIVLFERAYAVSRWLARVRASIAEGAVGPGFRILRPPLSTRVAARDHVGRARVRLRALDVLHDAESWADVVREAQEIVELALKGLLRAIGVEPPRIHDVSDILVAERERLPSSLVSRTERLAEASRQLRRDRELAFYGAEDLTPTGFYTRADAERARSSAREVVEAIAPHVLGPT